MKHNLKSHESADWFRVTEFCSSLGSGQTEYGANDVPLNWKAISPLTAVNYRDAFRVKNLRLPAWIRTSVHGFETRAILKRRFPQQKVSVSPAWIRNSVYGFGFRKRAVAHTKPFYLTLNQ